MNLKLGSKLKYLDFQKLKKILKIFFSAVTRLILKHILAIFRIIFQKIDIISDVIIPIAAILKKIFYHFFCNIKKYDCAKVHVKSIFLSGFTQGETLCAPPRGMIRQKYLGADRVNHTDSFLVHSNVCAQKYLKCACPSFDPVKPLK